MAPGPAPGQPPDVKALDREGLRALAAALGQPGYRAAQLERWLYARGARSFADMTDLPAAMRERLAEERTLSVPELAAKQESADGTRKYLWRLADGVTVETVGLPEGRRLTVCFSTQAGCAMHCAFCATGASGLVRDLAPGEMTDQVALVGRDFGMRVTNAVAMGQGEPFANYEAVLAALRFMNSDDGLGIGARHITVSTCGLTAGIRRFSEEPEQFTLAISLHSAVQATRDRLMPGLRRATLDSLRDEVRRYTQKTGRRVSFEYALIEGVNDTPEEVAALAAYCRGMLAHVNLIPVNAVADAGFSRTGEAQVADIAARLEAAGVAVSVRRERGADIDAACGQLRQRASAGPA